MLVFMAARWRPSQWAKGMLWELQEIPCREHKSLKEESSAMERVLNLEESISAMQGSILQRLSALEAREAAPHQQNLSVELAAATRRLAALEADIVALNLHGLDRRAAEVEAGASGHCPRHVRGTCMTSAKLDVSWKGDDVKTEVFEELQGVFSEASSSLDVILQRCGNQKVGNTVLGSIDMQLPSSQGCLSGGSGQTSTAATDSEEHAHYVNGYVVPTANQTRCGGKDSREGVKQAAMTEMREAVRVVVHNALQGLRRSEEELIVARSKELLATTLTNLGQLQADFAERFDEVGSVLTRQIEAFFEQRLDNDKVVVPGKVFQMQHDAPLARAHCQARPVVHDLATPPSSSRSSSPCSTSLASSGELLYISDPVDERATRQVRPPCVPMLQMPSPLYGPYANGRVYMEREPPLPPLHVSGRTKDPSFTQVGNSRGNAVPTRPTPPGSWQRAVRRVLI